MFRSKNMHNIEEDNTQKIRQIMKDKWEEINGMGREFVHFA